MPAKRWLLFGRGSDFLYVVYPGLFRPALVLVWLGIIMHRAQKDLSQMIKFTYCVRSIHMT